MDFTNYKKERGSYIHSSGRTIKLYLEQGDVDEFSGYTAIEDMYVVLNKEGYDVAGEYMTLEQGLSTVVDDIEMEKCPVRC